MAQEYVPGRRFYVVFGVLLVAGLLLGFYAASRSQWEGVAWSSVWIWLPIAMATGLAAPDPAQYALLRRFGARPRRVNWIERNNRPPFAWWMAPDLVFTKARFVVSYGVPVVIPSAVLLAYVHPARPPQTRGHPRANLRKGLTLPRAGPPGYFGLSVANSLAESYVIG